MCLAAFSIRQYSEYPLVIIHNRDEFKSRDFLPLGKRGRGRSGEVYGGLDQKSGGMWFGISETGRIALVLNFRDPRRRRPEALSRGLLVHDFLFGDQSLEEYLDSIV